MHFIFCETFPLFASEGKSFPVELGFSAVRGKLREISMRRAKYSENFSSSVGKALSRFYEIIHNSVVFPFFSSRVLTLNQVGRLIFRFLLSKRIYVLRKKVLRERERWIKLFAITCKKNGSWLESGLLIKSYLHTRVLKNVNDKINYLQVQGLKTYIKKDP